MQFFINIIKRILKEEKKVLGRCNIDYCNKKIDNKIDYSNQDHCGPCGKFNISNKDTINNLDSLIKNSDKKYEFSKKK